MLFNPLLREHPVANVQPGMTLHLPFPELPADFTGYLPSKVETSLRPALRRKFRAIYDGLVASGASVSHHRSGELNRKPVHESSHVLVWLLDNVEQVTGELR